MANVGQRGGMDPQRAVSTHSGLSYVQAMLQIMVIGGA